MLWGNPSSWMVDAVISQPYLDMNWENGWGGFSRILQSCPHPLLPVARQDPFCTSSSTYLRADPTYGYTKQLFSLGCFHGCHSALLPNRSSSSRKLPELTPTKAKPGGGCPMPHHQQAGAPSSEELYPCSWCNSSCAQVSCLNDHHGEIHVSIYKTHRATPLSLGQLLTWAKTTTGHHFKEDLFHDPPRQLCVQQLVCVAPTGIKAFIQHLWRWK